MNNELLDLLSNIEEQTILSEMAVLEAISNECMKQAAILEYASEPEEFECIMEGVAIYGNIVMESGDNGESGDGSEEPKSGKKAKLTDEEKAAKKEAAKEKWKAAGAKVKAAAQKAGRWVKSFIGKIIRLVFTGYTGIGNAVRNMVTKHTAKSTSKKISIQDVSNAISDLAPDVKNELELSQARTWVYFMAAANVADVVESMMTFSGGTQMEEDEENSIKEYLNAILKVVNDAARLKSASGIYKIYNAGSLDITKSNHNIGNIKHHGKKMTKNLHEKIANTNAEISHLIKNGPNMSIEDFFQNAAAFAGISDLTGTIDKVTNELYVEGDISYDIMNIFTSVYTAISSQLSKELSAFVKEISNIGKGGSPKGTSKKKDASVPDKAYSDNANDIPHYKPE